MFKYIKKLYERDIAFLLFLIVSACFYGILSVFIIMSFNTSNETIKEIIKEFSFNDFATNYMVIGITYVLSNLGDKYLSNPKNFEMDERGKLKRTTKRKIIVAWLWLIFFVINTVLYMKLNLTGVRQDSFNIVSIAGNLVAVIVFVLGGETTQEMVAILPSPIAKILQKNTNNTETKEG